jgi:hypothetical protein
LVIRIVAISYGISCVMRSLSLVVKKFPLDKQKVRWELKGWLVEAALARLGSRQLASEEQREMFKVTRTPTGSNGPSGGRNLRPETDIRSR